MKPGAICKNPSRAEARIELALSGHSSVMRVPFFTTESAGMACSGAAPDAPDHAHLDIVRDATRLDRDAALTTIEDEGHGDHGLERIALSAARRRDIGFPRGNAHGEVEQGLNRVVGDAGGPLSVTTILPSPTATETTGATPASSQASSASSTSSFTR